MTDIQEAIFSLISERYRPKRMSDKGIFGLKEVVKLVTNDVLELSDTYNQNRNDVRAGQFSKASTRAAYISHFLPLNYAKSYMMFEQVLPVLKHFLGDASKLRILDLGSGPGSSSLGAAAFFTGVDLEVTMVDRSRHLVEDGRYLLNKVFPTVRVNTLTQDVVPRTISQIAKTGPYDLILCSNFLNEFEGQKRPSEIAEMLEKLASQALHPKSGLMLIMEPALKKTARYLFSIRDASLEGLYTLAPCLHQKLCPFSRRTLQREWCFYEQNWLGTNLTKALDKVTGLDHRQLRFSYWLSTLPEIAKNFSIDQVVDVGSCPHRTVSNPIALSRGFKQFLCGKETFVEVRSPPKSLKTRGHLVNYCPRDMDQELELKDAEYED